MSSAVVIIDVDMSISNILHNNSMRTALLNTLLTNANKQYKITIKLGIQTSKLLKLIFYTPKLGLMGEWILRRLDTVIYIFIFSILNTHLTCFEKYLPYYIGFIEAAEAPYYRVNADPN